MNIVNIFLFLQTIQAVQPDVVLVELCKSRVDILKYDEEFLLREAKNIDMQKLKIAIKQVSLPVWILEGGGNCF